MSSLAALRCSLTLSEKGWPRGTAREAAEMLGEGSIVTLITSGASRPPNRGANPAGCGVGGSALYIRAQQFL